MKGALAALALFVLTVLMPQHAQSQDAATFAPSLTVPVFDRVDARGVDLVTGSLRVPSLTMSRRQDQYATQRGLMWIGQAWTVAGHPSVWRDGDKYVVMYRGHSEEFNDRGKGYSSRRPVSGGKFGCEIIEPGNFATRCRYIDRDGDIVFFEGIPLPSSPRVAAYGPSALVLGNLGMYKAVVRSANRASENFGRYSYDAGFAVEHYYNARTVTIIHGDQRITIETPNHDGKDVDEHYLRLKDVTQTISDQNGTAWRYTFNNDRRMVRIDPPAGGSLFSYNGDKKVRSVTTAAGTWVYDYTQQGGDYGVTTVTDPNGLKIRVRYHKTGGYVNESFEDYDPRLSDYRRKTYYDYVGEYRMRRIRFPEGNYTELDFDSRGNVLARRLYSKPNAVGAHDVVASTAAYPSTCIDVTTCNRPSSATDDQGRVTDFFYKTPQITSEIVNVNPNRIEN